MISTEFNAFEIHSCRDLLYKPLSGYLLSEALVFRNGEDDDTSVTAFMKNLFTEIFFVGIAVMAIAEGTARVALGVIVMIGTLLCCCRGFNTAVNTTTASLLRTVDLPLRCFKGFLINFFVDEDLAIQDLTICELFQGMPHIENQARA